MAMIIIATGVMLAYAGCLVWDSYMSVKGIRAGIALEGNDILRKFCGLKPTAKQFAVYDVCEFLVVCGLYLFAVIVGADKTDGPLYLASCGPMLAGAIKHFSGARKWMKLGV